MMELPIGVTRGRLGGWAMARAIQYMSCSRSGHSNTDMSTNVAGSARPYRDALTGEVSGGVSKVAADQEMNLPTVIAVAVADHRRLLAGQT